jgi:N-acyl-D-aspartate/D-glutamate deacylase
MHDSVIRGGLVVDGSGSPARHADVAIDDGVITEVGDDVGRGRRTIDADGLLVTPGVVDIHTHYDGQVTWDPEVTPSSWHGVTTIVMGNCGVGFAPADPARRDWLIQLMEGVEDIPGTALDEGMTWEWETFPQYLDEVERMARVMDVAAQVPHGAVRAYVMGERGAANEEATEGDIAEMSRIVEEALRAGAIGFSTTRTLLHRAKDGELAAGTTASAAELTGIGEALGRAGAGVFEIASDMFDPDFEFGWMRNDRAAHRSARVVRLPREPDHAGQLAPPPRALGRGERAGAPHRAAGRRPPGVRALRMGVHRAPVHRPPDISRARRPAVRGAPRRTAQARGPTGDARRATTARGPDRLLPVPVRPAVPPR